MAVVLICAPDPLVDELHGTLLWREGIERHVATGFEEALVNAVAARPHLVVIDRDLPRAERLVRDLRANPSTHHVSIAIVARDSLNTAELGLLAAGANALLRLPAGPDWEHRLAQLMEVPARRQTRVPVRIEFEGRGAPPVETVWGTILNVSTSGMLVRCAAPLRVGADLDLSFRLPTSTADIRGCATVVRQTGADWFGLRFYALEGRGPEEVRRFVEGT